MRCPKCTTVEVWVNTNTGIWWCSQCTTEFTDDSVTVTITHGAGAFMWDPTPTANKDPRTAQLDEVSEWLSKATKSKQGDMYKALYNLGWRIGGIDHEIAKAWREENPK